MPRDKEKKRLYNLAYYTQHKLEIAKRRKGYYLSKRDHLRDYSRRWYHANPQLAKEKRLRWNAANPERVKAHRRASGRRAYMKNTPHFVAQRRRYWLKKKYGITPEFYESLVVKQKAACAICGGTNDKNSRWGTKERFLQIDHCHETKQVRGLLCYFCNVALGLFRHDTKRLAAAIRYLSRA